MKKAFISFDYDHDLELKTALIGQAEIPDSPFSITDFSIQEAISSDWKEKARVRIKNCDLVIVICGEYTHTAKGVSTELGIAQEEKVPYFLLKGHPDKTCTKPTAARSGDTIYKWTWNNLKGLIGGAR